MLTGAGAMSVTLPRTSPSSRKFLPVSSLIRRMTLTSHVAEFELDLVAAWRRRHPVRRRLVVQPRPTTVFKPCEQQGCGQQQCEDAEGVHVRRILNSGATPGGVHCSLMTTERGGRKANYAVAGRLHPGRTLSVPVPAEAPQKATRICAPPPPVDGKDQSRKRRGRNAPNGGQHVRLRRLFCTRRGAQARGGPAAGG